MSSFVDYLFTNQALQNLHALQREEHLLLFLRKSEQALAPTLSSSSYFPELQWNQIYDLLQKEIQSRTNVAVASDIKQILSQRIDFSYLSELGGRNVNTAEIRQEIEGLISRFMRKNTTRSALIAPYTAVYFGLPERYIHLIYARSSYTHFELTKVQRLPLDSQQMINMLYTILLIRPAIAFLSTDSTYEETTGHLQKNYLDKTVSVLQAILKSIPVTILQSALNSCISFTSDRFIEATSRLTAIFSARGKNYHPNIKVDRGANTPDRSWLTIVRRSYKYYGFDIKIIDELYSIAAERGW